MNKLEVSNIPLLEKGWGGRAIKKMDPFRNSAPGREARARQRLQFASLLATNSRPLTQASPERGPAQVRRRSLLPPRHSDRRRKAETDLSGACPRAGVLRIPAAHIARLLRKFAERHRTLHGVVRRVSCRNVVRRDAFSTQFSIALNVSNVLGREIL